ncbi:MAG: HAMP domain-containing sensor histidine kinase [Hyphomonadaceae bacterium]|nr:HAMP domain-containing sensor histidine kinase [Hyphomonadaceae bacterium]
MAWGLGADPVVLGEAVALAIAPGLAGLVLLPWLDRPAPALALLATWMLAATGLVAGGGGVLSPLATLFAVAPALALGLGRNWAAESGAAAVLAYAAGAGLALLAPEPAILLGPFPETLSVAALALLAALLALGRTAAPAPASSDELGRRVAEVSHEMRTPLTHILGFAELIETQIFGPIEARYVEYAGLIRRSGSQLLELVNDHLDVSRIEAGKYALELEEFDARAIVEEVVRMSADSAERKGIALSAWLPSEPLMVRADVRALRRMLINTLGNALKFTPEGGRVVVAAKAAGEMLVLETIDNGPGIPAGERARLGQAYERGGGGAGVEGAGLGLSLVRAMSALHGGRLSFHDAPGGGALVRIELPVLARP